MSNKKQEIIESTKLKEPEFVKLYLKDISLLYELSQTATHLFFELIQFIEYNPNNMHNVIFLTKTRKHKLFTGLHWNSEDKNKRSKYTMYAKYIKELADKKILRKVDEDIYLINPDLCGKTSWTNLQIVKSLSLNLTYDIVGRTLVTLFENKEELKDDLLDSLIATKHPVKPAPKLQSYLLESKPPKEINQADVKKTIFNEN